MNVLHLAQTQQEAVLQAMRDSASTETPVWVVWALLGVAAGGIAALVIYQRHQARKPAEPIRKVMRNSKKLVREVTDSLGLSPAEVRKLEHHAESAGVENPLTLLLCPSLVKKSRD
jgi:hypothetical protein